VVEDPRAEAVDASVAKVADTDGLQRPPAPIPTSAKGAAMAFVVRLGPDAKGTRMRFPKKATAADAIGWIAGNLVPVRTDLTGRLTGWYRLHHDGKPVAPQTTLSELNPELPLVVHTVPNEVRLVEIHVKAASESRFLAPVGTAVPVVSLVDHLTAWLDLPAGDYRLHSEHGPLQPQVILADIWDESMQAASSNRLQLTLRLEGSG
jgi:hypothetical protein